MDSLLIIQTIEEIEKFLKPYQQFWSMEILNNYPNTYEDSIEEMANEPKNWDSQKIANMINFEDEDLSPKLQSFSDSCKELANIPQANTSPIDILKDFQLSNKKKHELSHLIPLLDCSVPILDFAGGTGHLSEQFSNFSNQHSTCLDIDNLLLSKGRKRLKSKNVEFKEYTIKSNMVLKAAPSNLVALHNCGDLSDHVISYFKKNSNAIKLYNLGCCYHKCSNHFGTNLQLSNHAKTLAIRSSYQKASELLKRIQVKKFRYSFELLLQSEFGKMETSSLLSSTQGYYKSDFSYYATEQLKRLNLKSSIPLNSFYKDPNISKKVERLIRLGFIRHMFSRIIEKLIIYHRAKTLSTISKVEIKQVFDFRISPRNILITASKK